MSDNIETKWIAVPNLLLDIENPRLDPVENQHAAIFEMMDKEGESIIELTKSLIEMGYVPYELPIVYPNAIESGTYIVKEGNRRIIALKLLAEPDILSEKKISNIIKNLKN